MLHYTSPILGLHIGPACEAGVSAGMQREHVQSHRRKKERKWQWLAGVLRNGTVHLFVCHLQRAAAGVTYNQLHRCRPVARGGVEAVRRLPPPGVKRSLPTSAIVLNIVRL